MRDFQARLRYLDEVITLLYPPPSSPEPPAKRPAGAAYALVPSRFMPRRLAPRARWLPGRRRLPQGPGTIEAHLGEVFGQPVRATAHVRPARRANRKPILEIHGSSGELLAFVKIGESERSRELVRHEAAVLRLLAATSLKAIVVPTVLHDGVWNGLEVLALSPLPVRRGRIRPSLLHQAVQEIATLDLAPADHTEPALRSTADPSPAPAPLHTATGHHDRRAGHGGHSDQSGHGGHSGHRDQRGHGHGGHGQHGDQSGHGGHGDQSGHGGSYAWHGDFSPWNMAPSPDGRLLVWDWERFATGVPLGFDALHHFFQRALRRMPPRLAAEACLAQAVRTLAPFGSSAGESRETAVRYLIALAGRYERDGHHPLGPASEWLNPLADHLEVLL
ncbi:hypothetical protein [Sphaerisporangium flaviroseum]|uniref:hypothetical protein n=1 Tax=Sphaerisporangium flaviroseum TaxID=509199 RepID=UPI0031E9A5AE